MRDGLKLKSGLSFQGEYTLTLKNMVTGKTKVVRTHNVWTYGGWTFLFTASTNGNSANPKHHHAYINAICCGSGTGTPAESDTGLFNQLFVATSGSNGVTLQNSTTETVDDNTKKIGFEFVIPASSSFVGTITEVGLKSNCSNFITHALLQDAEGNPLSLEKTDTDQLTVRVEIQVSRPSADFGLRFNLRWGRYANANGLLVANTPTRGLWYMGSGLGSYNTGAFAISKATNPDYYLDIEKAGDTNSITITNDVCVIAKTRFTAESSPSFYVNMLSRYMRGEANRAFFGIVFPCSDVFAQRTLTGLALGTGDGTTKEFNAILPAWVKDTEVIYKNGTALTRDVDYTCDSAGNPQMDVGMTAGNFLQKIVQGDHGTGGYCIPGYSVSGGENVYATPDEPIILQYYTDPLIGNTIDTIVPGSWSGLSNGVTLTFSVSEDGTTYTDVLTVTYGTDDFTAAHSLGASYVMKYMKIKPSAGTVHQSSNNGKYMHLGTGIVFKEAPASGDVLTMDADIDRPWKSTDYIIDFAGQITF